MFITISLVFLGIAVICLLGCPCAKTDISLFNFSVGFVVSVLCAVIFFVIGFINAPYVEVQRYDLQDYSLTVTESPFDYIEKFTGTTYNHIEFELDLHEIRKEGNKPVLVKYQLKVPILGYCSRYRYDLILPVDSAETKAGGRYNGKLYL